MIPKNLFYCNFGNMTKRPSIEGECLKSWEHFFPRTEWRWVEINETNYDINQHFYTKNSYLKKKYNLVADYARVDVLLQEGGVYVDMDLLMIKSFDTKLLELPAFIGAGEHPNAILPVSWGIFGCEKNNPFFKQVLEYFQNSAFSLNPLDTKSIKEILIKKEQCELNNLYDGAHLTTIDILPFKKLTCNGPKALSFNTDQNSMCIHLYGQSWMPKSINHIHEYNVITKLINWREYDSK